MISHHFKCIFVHIPKTAGQSIEHHLVSAVGLTWDTRLPLLSLHNDNPNVGPPQLDHLKAIEYLEYKYLSEELFNNYFKFAFVRNPWDRVVSMYKYFGYWHRCSFKTFVKQKLGKRLWNERYYFVCPQSEYVCCQDGNVIVDFVGRYEALQSDFDEACRMTGLPISELPHVNRSGEKEINFDLHPRELVRAAWRIWCKVSGSFFHKFDNFQDYYDSETAKIVEDLYREDLELFDYHFE